MEEIYKKRRELTKVLNPALGQGTLTYTNDYLSKSIKCYCSGLPAMVERYGLAMLFGITFTATNPFWFDTFENGVKLEGFSGGLHFPFKFNSEIHFAESGMTAHIDIDGDIAAPMRAEFRCAEETANIPKLINETTGEFIEVNTLIDTDEKLVITTDYGNKTVKLIADNGTETNAYHLININSSFFQLQQGRNTLTFAANTGIPSVYVFWRNYYVGV